MRLDLDRFALDAGTVVPDRVVFFVSRGHESAYVTVDRGSQRTTQSQAFALSAWVSVHRLNMARGIVHRGGTSVRGERHSARRSCVWPPSCLKMFGPLVGHNPAGRRSAMTPQFSGSKEGRASGVAAWRRPLRARSRANPVAERPPRHRGPDAMRQGGFWTACGCARIRRKNTRTWATGAATVGSVPIAVVADAVHTHPQPTTPTSARRPAVRWLPLAGACQYPVTLTCGRRDHAAGRGGTSRLCI